MKAKCPYCKTVQEVNSRTGDVDLCDDCGRKYNQFVNAVSHICL